MRKTVIPILQTRTFTTKLISPPLGYVGPLHQLVVRFPSQHMVLKCVFMGYLERD